MAPHESDDQEKDRDDTTEMTLNREVWKLFGDSVLASQSTGEKREAIISRMTDTVMDNPVLMSAFQGLLEPEEEVEVYEEIEAILINAADPFTGIVPGDFQLPSHLQAVYDATPSLQQLRDDLPSILGNNVDDELENAVAAINAMPRASRPRRMFDKAINLTSGLFAGIDVAPAFALRSVALHGDDADTEDEEIVGDQRTSPIIWHDEDETIFIAEIWVYKGNDQYDVRLQAASDRELKRPIPRDDWRPVAWLGDQTITASPDPDEYLDWRLDSRISREDLERLRYGDAE